VTPTEPSSGGSTDSAVDDGNEVGRGVAVGAEVVAGKPVVDAQPDDPTDAEGAGDDEAVNDGGTDIPGGGAATASGSSISSKGRSGSCSSKAETGTAASPLGAPGLAEVPVADAAGVVELNPAALVDAKVAGNPGVVPLAVASLGVNVNSVDELSAFDEPGAAAPTEGEGVADGPWEAVPVAPEPAVPGPNKVEPTAVESTGAESRSAKPGADGPEAAEPPLAKPDAAGLAAAEPALAELAAAELAAAELPRAELPEPTADGFPAGELMPVATPTGLIVLFVPVVAASFATVLDDGALRDAAPAAPGTFEDGAAAEPIGTPTGLEAVNDADPARLAAAWVADVADAVVPDLSAPALAAPAELEPAAPAREPIADASLAAPIKLAPTPASAPPREMPVDAAPEPPISLSRSAPIVAVLTPASNPPFEALVGAAAPEPVADPSRASPVDMVLAPATDPLRPVPIEAAPAAELPRDVPIGAAAPALAANAFRPARIGFVPAALVRARLAVGTPVPDAPVESALAPAVAPPRAEVPSPLVPSTRAGAPGSAAPNNISGSSSSADAISVGTSTESGGASGITEPDAAEREGAAEASGPRSSNAPCESKSSSESIKLFAVEGAGDPAPLDVEVGGVPAGDVTAAAAPVAGEEVRPDGDPLPANSIGSSTGRSAKGSKAGREALSIVFEPESRRSILNVSCNASAELPRRWLTERQGRPYVVTRVTLYPVTMTIFGLQKSDAQSSILPFNQVQGRQSVSITPLTRIVGHRRLCLSSLLMACGQTFQGDRASATPEEQRREAPRVRRIIFNRGSTDHADQKSVYSPSRCHRPRLSPRNERSGNQRCRGRHRDYDLQLSGAWRDIS